MELRNELCANLGRTETKMNEHFVPRVFICLQAVNTHVQHWLARSACWPSCLFHLEIFPFWLLEAW